ncbi:MAG: MBL fold metallo-hydrolase [Magnetovibrionaceae bacterium]
MDRAPGHPEEAQVPLSEPARVYDPMENILGCLPEPGGMIEVAPGIHWLRMPLPFALNHINLWVLDDGEGWCLVDTGINREDVRDLWEQLFAGPLAAKPVKRLICTHFHPDHLGLAGWLCDRFGMVPEMTQQEWAVGRMLSLEREETVSAAGLRFYAEAGFGPDLMEKVKVRGPSYAKRVCLVPGAFRRFRHGDEISVGGRSWRIIVGEGHSPEHAALYCEEAGVLISGDQILPKISPNISVWPNEPDANPLSLYLETLGRFRDLPADTLVLPSHNWPFRGLLQRVEALAHHHDQRLDETEKAVRDAGGQVCALDIMAVLFRRKLDDHQLFFAIGEAVAHLHYLVSRGRLVSEKDGDDVVRFSAPAP